VEKQDYYPLSPVQKRLYIMQQADLQDMTYHLPLVRVLWGRLEPQRLAMAFRLLIARHESFRTSFHLVGGQPVQRIQEKAEWGVECYDPVQSGPDKPIRDFIRPFDLGRAPLLRVGLARVEAKTHLLMIDMHHIIADGASLKILVQEFSTLYARARDGHSPLPRLQLQYKDFALWQHGSLRRQEFRDQEAYWLARFRSAVPRLSLTDDEPASTERDRQGSRFDISITRAQTRQWRQLARQQDVTLFMLLLAAYLVLLHKLSWREDIVVGTPVLGREDADLLPLIGMFVNTLALRNFPVPGKSFGEFLKEVKQHTIEAFENQAYPFGELVEKASGGHAPFNTMFVLQNLDIPDLKLPGLTIKTYDYQHPLARFDLTWTVVEEADSLRLEIEYRCALFDEAAIGRFVGYFQEIMRLVRHNIDIPLKEIDIVPEFSDSPATLAEEASGDFGF
jgi:hypothetical protein